MRLIVCLIMVLPLIGCGIAPSLDDPKLSNKQLNLEEFFDGEIIAYGQFQDTLGNVTRRFEVDIQAEMVGKTLTLVEDFHIPMEPLSSVFGHLKKSEMMIGLVPLMV